MIIDASSGSRDALQRPFDVCVVGGGPAGISVARRVAAAGLSVALLEGGGLEFSSESQDLYAGDSIGQEYYPTDTTRLRFLGGTSNHWGGRCRPLEVNDFKPHPYHPLSGWPIARGDLDPYAAEADDILDLPGAEVFPDRTDDYAGADMTVIRFRQSPPTLFGEKYRAEIEASERIALAVNANLVDLELDPSLATVTGAAFRSFTPGDPGFTVTARTYCLCMGGLENPRFLLNANRQIPAGIGNQHDLVGRFFAEHIAYRAGRVLFADEVPTRRGYEPTPKLMDANGILNFNLLMDTKSREFGKELARSLTCSADFIERLAEEVLGRTINCDFGGIGEYFGNLRAEDRDVGTFGIIIEQSLNRDSRVLLGDKVDPFGHRRLVLDWQFSDLDRHTLQTSAMLIGQQFAERGVGRVQLSDWLLAEDFSWPQMSDGKGEVGLHHHLCTTRMSSDPRQGVVDANCRVHGTSNLYVGGSSIFATGGHANPTYTIVQLALRLGDHLATLPAG
jgi:choline dehydrogenase-like flavoprotein